MLGEMSSLRTTVVGALATAVAVAGCGASGTTVTKNPRYWLVKVEGNYANIYAYPEGTVPGKVRAIELGTTEAAKRSQLDQAAAQLGVPVSHITDESAS